MSNIARTNLFLSQLMELNSWSVSSGSEPIFRSAYCSFVLVLEQALLALINEMGEAESKKLPLTDMSALFSQDPNQLNLAARQVVLASKQIDHWIYDWYHARRNIQAIVETRSVKPADDVLIAATLVNEKNELQAWLDGFTDLMTQCREQDNYY